MATSGEQVRPPGVKGVFQWFVHWEAAGSIVLLLATVVALVWANSPWRESYEHLLHTPVSVSFGEPTLTLSLHHWINDALMVVFFFVVGLEIKREVVLGQLSSPRLAALPVAAALGGMVVPAAIYFLVNGSGEGARGWGVPMATDIAFALGILALFGKRVPIGLKVFLTALAIADDLGAVLVIAVFYTEQINLAALVVAAVFLLLIFGCVVFRIRRAGIYLLLAAGVWLAVFLSGVHATVAGILVAFLIPVRPRFDPRESLENASRAIGEIGKVHLTKESMIHDGAQLDSINRLSEAAFRLRPPGLYLEHYFHPVQAFLILPLFALFNAGVHFETRILETLLEPISLGVVLGLVVGKQVGITLAAWLAIRSGAADMPRGVTWPQIWGVAALAGIGFTMSIFVSELAFSDPSPVGEAKIGILAASLIAGICGVLVLRKSLPPAPATEEWLHPDERAVVAEPE